MTQDRLTRSAGVPRLRPLTQSFEDPEIEEEYRRSINRQTANDARLALVLAVVLFAAFGVMDALLGVPVRITLPIRAAVIACAVLLLSLSHTRFFLRHRERLLLAFCLVMTVALGAIIAVADDAVGDRYYVGFLLIVMASYFLMVISFLNASWVALANIAVNTGVEWLFHRPLDLGTLNNALFLVSAALIAAVGGYSLSRQRRLAFYQRILLARESAESRHSALHDMLTGLPNRRLVMDRLAHAMARDQRYGKFSAVLFIDLDNFKPLNDRHGHAFGDLALKAVAERLLRCARETDTAARVGGDEFVVLLESLDSPEKAREAQRRVAASFREPLEVNGMSVDLGASVGLAVFPGDGETVDDLLSAADEAMFREKQRDRDQR